MKAKIAIFLFALMAGTAVFAQSGKSVEVLYFKANLACCKAKSCNALEADLQTIIQKNFPDGNIIFREVKLAEDSNKVLVEKYKAQSQTVVLVKIKKKKEMNSDISDIIKKFVKDQNKEELEIALVESINAFSKKKK
ncbi:MAG: hypothetical protein A2W93_01740 [Bacteroidetes bacterium GWF2_43_63]|nr:MAG: hypothetical protein A2W94_10335 [Bacteroidetes bacterium GWE2_42_42]OFY55788.1 MAG: hypothetical protein A2W93_01740 [Bacteroidetes bacterium GWF2_43_63]HBG71294.1 hypothetical protein [Bacteroidales bacterium]HCB60485.1 hypothetical protein [Bacteroidales bacterium]HCY22558.1 hypothetical protein [Bacteroidales bacterium]